MVIGADLGAIPDWSPAEIQRILGTMLHGETHQSRGTQVFQPQMHRDDPDREGAVVGAAAMTGLDQGTTGWAGRCACKGL